MISGLEDFPMISTRNPLGQWEPGGFKRRQALWLSIGTVLSQRKSVHTKLWSPADPVEWGNGWMDGWMERRWMLWGGEFPPSQNANHSKIYHIHTFLHIRHEFRNTLHSTHSIQETRLYN